MPIKYTVLGAAGKNEAMNILAFHLQTKDTDNDQVPDILDTEPGA